MEGIIAIDPGSGGALAFITDASHYSEAYKCPSTTREMFAVYNHLSLIHI